MANTEPFRLRVQKALTAALEQIVPEGETQSLTGKVFRGRAIFGDNDPLPMISILESITERDLLNPPPAGRSVKTPWELLVQGWTYDDFANPTDPAQHMLAQVKKRLTQLRVEGIGPQGERNLLGLGPRVDNIVFSTGVVRPADEVSSKAYFWLKVQIDIVENLLDPYHD